MIFLRQVLFTDDDPEKERLSNLPKDKQLINGMGGTQIWQSMNDLMDCTVLYLSMTDLLRLM